MGENKEILSHYLSLMGKMIKLYDVRWRSHTAGPSPVENNTRTELFFMGCNKAASGNPCSGCFNPDLWEVRDHARDLDVEEMVSHIKRYAPYPYISVVGGEPFDQPQGLVELCEGLKAERYHIIVFTHYRLVQVYENPPEGWNQSLLHRLLKAVNIVVDGPYEFRNRMYDESVEDGIHNAIGSSNQIIWICDDEGVAVGEKAGNVVSLLVQANNSHCIVVRDPGSEIILKGGKIN